MKVSPAQDGDDDDAKKQPNSNNDNPNNHQQQHQENEGASPPTRRYDNDSSIVESHSTDTDDDCNIDGSSSRRRTRLIPIVTTPKRGLSGASTSTDEGDGDGEEQMLDAGDELVNGAQGVSMPSFHNSRGIPVQESGDGSATTSSSHSLHPASAGSQQESNTNNNNDNAGKNNNNANTSSSSVSADQERQILLLMLLAQVCALHDPTPRTFTVHVLELFERGILGRQSIHFLFELGLVPSTTPRLLPPSTTSGTGSTTAAASENNAKEQILDLTTVSASTAPTSPQTLRAQEASAIRSHLEQHDLAHQLQQQARTSANANNMANSETFLVASPKSAAGTSPTCNASSWAVEHHPLSLSRYQREFHQVRLLNAGSFGEVFQSTNKIDLKDYAVKRVAFSAWGYSKDSVTQVIREVHCLAQCDHPNVVRYYTSWLEPSWMTGSGATMMLSSTDNSPVEVRRQQKLLTDIQHMMVTGGGSSQGEPSSEYWGGEHTNNSMSPSASDNNHIQDFFQDHAATLRNRNFSIGSSMDSVDSAGIDSFNSGAGSSYDETSSSEEEDASAWTVEESHASTIRDDSIRFESHRKDVWETSASPPRHHNKKKQKPAAAAAARLKYRYQICLFIQMQLCHPATLGDWIRHRNAQSDPEQDRQERVETCIKIFGQIVGGLEHIHKKGIVHRDLKPANLFRSLEDEEVFLIGDFGLSKLIQCATHPKSKGHHSSPAHANAPPPAESNHALVIHPPPMPSALANSATTWQDPLTAGVGTASYAAPEQVTTRSYGKMADVFSLGLILLEMCCVFGTEHERMQTFYDARHRRAVPSWITQEYPTVAKTILECTDPNPANRPSAEDLLQVEFTLVSSAKPAATSVVQNETSSEAEGDQKLESLYRELQQKNEQLLAHEQKLEEKDRTIERLRQEVAGLKLLSQGVGVQSQQTNFPRRARGSNRGNFEADEVASSSSSSDGV